MNSEARENLITEALGRRILPLDPTFDDFKKYSKIRLRKSRSKKKFRKNPQKYLPRCIRLECFASQMVAPIREALNYDGIGRKIFKVVPINEITNIHYDPLPVSVV